MGGRELAARIRAANPTIPILFMSGYSEDVEIVRELSPPVDFLPKPFTLDLVASRSRRLLETKQQT